MSNTNIVFKTIAGTPVQCIPLLTKSENKRDNKNCVGMIFKTPNRTVVCGGFLGDFYMRSDGWSGEGGDPVALLENYAVTMKGATCTLTEEFTIRKSDKWHEGDTTIEAEFADTAMMLFRAYAEV